MRCAWPLACAVIGLAAAAPLYAQTPGEPQLFWSVFAGYRAGARLWVLHDQPFAVFVSSGDTADPTSTEARLNIATTALFMCVWPPWPSLVRTETRRWIAVVKWSISA